MPHGYTPYLIVLGVLAVIGLRVMRSLRGQRIRVDTLWVAPALLLAATVSMVAQSPPRNGQDIAGLTLAALLGAGVGWQRGKLTRISLDAETGVLTSKASPAAVLLLVALFLARYSLRAWMLQNPGQGGSWAVGADALVLFGAAMIVATRLEMWLRCRRLIAAGAGHA